MASPHSCLYQADTPEDFRACQGRRKPSGCCRGERLLTLGRDGAEQVFGQRRALTPFPEAGDLPAAPALYYRSPSEKIAVT